MDVPINRIFRLGTYDGKKRRSELQRIVNSVPIDQAKILGKSIFQYNTVTVVTNNYWEYDFRISSIKENALHAESYDETIPYTDVGEEDRLTIHHEKPLVLPISSIRKITVAKLYPQHCYYIGLQNMTDWMCK